MGGLGGTAYGTLNVVSVEWVKLWRLIESRRIEDTGRRVGVGRDKEVKGAWKNVAKTKTVFFALDSNTIKKNWY